MKDTIKYIILEQLITEGRVEDAKTKYACLPPKLVDYFSQNDPSRNNKYLDWMCKQIWDENEEIGQLGDYGSTIWYWLQEQDASDCETAWSDHVNYDTTEFGNGELTFDEIPVVSWLKGMADMIIEEVNTFHKFVSGLEQKDINQYDYETLGKALAMKKLKSQEKKLAKDVTKIYEDDEWLIVSPKTHQASCAYGAHTKWCVTQRDDDHYFKNYTQGNAYLMFVINKKDNDKWAINTDRPLGSELKNIEVNLPWHRQIRLDYSGNYPVERFHDREHNSKVERELRMIHGSRNNTSYYNAIDDEISWDEFIDESGLPNKLQELLKYVESKVTINFARKKKTDVAYETNQNPVRLKKGDKVKLLASGYGYLRGDEGYVVKTIAGALPSKGKNVDSESAGLSAVYVPNRDAIGGERERVSIKKDDKLLTKLNITVPEGSNNVYITTLNINGVYLKKID